MDPKLALNYFTEVQIAIQSVGVCGSDVKYWTDGHSGIPLTGPMILGHECSGVVSKLGEGVKELNIGKGVLIVYMYMYIHL